MLGCAENMIGSHSKLWATKKRSGSGEGT
jgi:hypothetical protein